MAHLQGSVLASRQIWFLKFVLPNPVPISCQYLQIYFRKKLIERTEIHWIQEILKTLFLMLTLNYVNGLTFISYTDKEFHMAAP